jgi:hypothetical protein
MKNNENQLQVLAKLLRDHLTPRFLVIASKLQVMCHLLNRHLVD